jgi:glycosyltransferase involved in cell wall biosynthesis
MNELISIIIPAYMAEKHLSRCLASITIQTYKNIEIIVINDGSKDNTHDVSLGWVERDSRIKLVDKENGGAASARNVGIDISSGEFIAFIDSDDWVEPDYIEHLYNMINSYNADLAICSFVVASDLKSRECNKNRPNIVMGNLEALEQLNGNYYLQFVVPWGKLYRKSIFFNIRYPDGKFVEDEFIAHRLIYNANIIVFTEGEYIYYWKHPESLMGKGHSMEMLIDARLAYIDRISFYYQKGLRKHAEIASLHLFLVLLRLADFFSSGSDEYKKYIVESRELANLLRKTKKPLKYRAILFIFGQSPDLAVKAYAFYLK